jgi:hypothetical protein
MYLSYSSASLGQLEDQFGKIQFFATTQDMVFAKFASGTCLKRFRWYNIVDIGTDESSDNWKVVPDFDSEGHYDAFFDNRNTIEIDLAEVDYQTFNLPADHVSKLFFGPGSYSALDVIEFEFNRKFNINIPQYCKSFTFVDIEADTVLYWYQTSSGSVIDYESGKNFVLSAPSYRMQPGGTFYDQLVEVGIIVTDEYLFESIDLPMAIASIQDLYPDVVTTTAKRTVKVSRDRTRSPKLKAEKLSRTSNRKDKMQMHF